MMPERFAGATFDARAVPPVISFVGSDRECSSLWTALSGPELGLISFRDDRSHGLETIGSDER